MNAPLPEAIRLALEAATLDDRQRCWRRRSHSYTAGCAAERSGFGVERTGPVEN